MNRISALLASSGRTPEHTCMLWLGLMTRSKRCFGLDDERLLIVLSESNRFVCPGPDPRPVNGDYGYYGPVPLALFADIRQRFVVLARSAQHQ